MPDLQRSFYDEQCNGRNMFIGPVDVEETELEIEITEAKKDERERTMKERKQREAEGKTLRLKKVSWGKVELSDNGFEEQVEGLEDFLAICERFGISETAAYNLTKLARGRVRVLLI